MVPAHKENVIKNDIKHWRVDDDHDNDKEVVWMRLDLNTIRITDL